MEKQHIERNEKGEIINWYGFIPTEDVSEKKCCIAVFWPEVDLYINGEFKSSIDCSEMIGTNIKAEKVVYNLSDIWNFIYKEFRKITTGNIYILKLDMDGLANRNWSNFMLDN